MAETLAERAARKAADIKKANKPAKEKDPKEPEPIPACPDAGLVKVYYENEKRNFYALNKQGEYQLYPERGLNLLLRRAGFRDDFKHLNGLSYLDSEYLRICEEHSVSYAGPLGGYPIGQHEMSGHRVLATTSRKPMIPKKGLYPLFKQFLASLLGREARYFCAWLQAALTSLEAGAPWTPGQMLAIAGPGNCGKSVLQSLITPMLGGRVSSPYAYMAGGDQFNAEIFGAEHGLIGDQNHKFDARSRRAFGAAVKDLCVNPEQRVRGHYKGGMTLHTYLRLSMTLNDNPQALLVLPQMDSDVADKIMLLNAHVADLPFPSERFPTMHDYAFALRAELPYFLYHLKRWKAPKEIYDRRYGVVSYKNADLIDKMNSLSSEWKFWNLVEMYVFADRLTESWEGTAAELEKLLRDRVKNENLSFLFYYPGACGSYLTTLAPMLDGLIEFDKRGGNLNYYWIKRPKYHAD